MTLDEEEDENEVSSVSESVIGGAAAREGDWPWLSVIYRKYNSGIMHEECAGALISPNRVLTARHCVLYGFPDSYYVKFGVQNLEDDSGHEQQIRVRSVARHPSLDIAVVTLQGNATYNKWVQPIPLATGNDGPGTRAVVAAWGAILFKPTRKALVPFVTTLPVRSNSSCNAQFANDLVAGESCLGYADGSKANCYGDSGAPIVVNRGNKWEVIGVVSGGSDEECVGYTRAVSVSQNLEWIYSITGALPDASPTPTRIRRIAVTCDGDLYTGEHLVDPANKFYFCENTFQRHCVDDGTWDFYFSERCDFAEPRCRLTDAGKMSCDSDARAPSNCRVSTIHRTTYTCDGRALRFDEQINASGYWNYTCGNRFGSQCVYDGSWDRYYDEWCEYTCN